MVWKSSVNLIEAKGWGQSMVAGIAGIGACRRVIVDRTVDY